MTLLDTRVTKKFLGGYFPLTKNSFRSNLRDYPSLYVQLCYVPLRLGKENPSTSTVAEIRNRGSRYDSPSLSATFVTPVSQENGSSEGVG